MLNLIACKKARRQDGKKARKQEGKARGIALSYAFLAWNTCYIYGYEKRSFNRGRDAKHP